MGAIYDRLRLWLGVRLPAGPFNWVVEERSYMGSVIEIAFRVEWERPVFVGEGDLLDQPIMGPRDALRYLQKYFPLRFGQTYWDAINACISALLRECDPAHARACFIAAYAECIVTIDDLWQDITCD